MRLLQPNPGECLDRQTILQLKIEYGSQPDTRKTEELAKNDETGKTARTVVENPGRVNIQPFIDENEQIQKYLENNWFPDLSSDRGQEFDEYYEELSDVNGQLWKLMDQANILSQAPDRMQVLANQRAAEVLFLIVELNAKRARLVNKVNELFSIKHQEKIFA